MKRNERAMAGLHGHVLEQVLALEPRGPRGDQLCMLIRPIAVQSIAAADAKRGQVTSHYG